MSTHTLTYFPVPGRAEVIRMCFYHTNKELKNEIIRFTDFPKLQKEGVFPLNQVPVFQVDNSGYICQSGAIARYAAKINGLYPKDPLKALYVDEVFETAQSLINATAFYYDADSEEKEKKRQSFLDREVTRLEHFMKLRVSKDSPFIAINEFSLADISTYIVINAHLIQYIGFSKEQLQAVSPTTFVYLDKLEKQEVFKNILEKSRAYLESLAK